MLSESEVQQAQSVQAKLDRRMAQIAGSRDLTPRAADRERARAILAARQGMSAIRASSAERDLAEQAKAYKQAFGLRPDRSAEDRHYRDSLAARDIGWQEAQAMFGQAQARGDDLAMTALAEYAWQRRANPLDGHAWVSGILDPYGELSEQYDSAIMTLLGAESPDRMAQFRDKVLTEVAQPPDLRGDLNYLAADEEGSSASA